MSVKKFLKFILEFVCCLVFAVSFFGAIAFIWFGSLAHAAFSFIVMLGAAVLLFD